MYQCDRCDKPCSNCEYLQERVWDLEYQIEQLKAELDSRHAEMCSYLEDNKKFPGDY
jgi:hypothetical protein